MVNAKELVGDIFGWIGSVISICFFVAPIVPFYKLIKEKITYHDAPGILLICTVINCILWVVYGIKLNKIQVYATNAIGGIITLFWIFIFIVFWVKKHILKTIGLIYLSLIIFAGLFLLFYFVVDPKKNKAEITGYCAMEFNILMYAAPGEKIYTVIKTKNHKLIPIFSTIFGVINSACWLVYGICESDLNVIVTNALGLFFAILQVVVYIVIKYTCFKEPEISNNVENDLNNINNINNVNDNRIDKNLPKVNIKANVIDNVPDSDKKLDIEGEKNGVVIFESERITVNKT